MKIIHFSLILGVSIILGNSRLSAADTQAEPTNSIQEKKTVIEAPFSLSEEQEKELFKVAKTLNEISIATLTQIMYELENNINFWRKQALSPRSYAITRGPVGWLGGRKTGSLIAKNIKILEEVEKLHAHALGTAHAMLCRKDLSYIQYCIQSLDILSPLMNTVHKRSYKKNNHAFLHVTLVDAIVQMTGYKQRFDRAISRYKKPSHLARHWLQYIIGITALSAAGYAIHTNRETLSSWYAHALEALHLQWQKRIIEPIKGIAKNIATKPEEIDNTPVKTTESIRLTPEEAAEVQKSILQTQQDIAKIENEIKKSKNILQKRQEHFKKETTAYFERRPDITSKKVRDQLIYEHINGDDTNVMHDIVDQAQHATWNLAKDLSFLSSSKNFRLPEASVQMFQFYKVKIDTKEIVGLEYILIVKKLLLQIYKWMLQKDTFLLEVVDQGLLEIDKIKKQGKQEWELQQVNIMLSTMFPAAIVLYGAYKISSLTFNYLFFKKIVLMPLQKRILSIRCMLNRFDDGQQTLLPMEAHGHMVYWAHKLKQYTIQLPEEYQESFKLDIQELESPLFTIKQKHEVIKRMYDVYGFLRGGS